MSELRHPFRAPFQVFFICCSLIIFSAGCGESAAERPLSELDPAQIPAELRFPDQPREVVAVLTSKSGTAGLVGIAFSPDGTRLAGGFGSGDLVVWNSGTLKEVAATSAHKLPISTIVFAPDGKTLIDSSYDHTARLWEIGKGELRQRATLSGHTDQIWGMSLAPDGKTLATASYDKTVRIWNLDDKPPKEIGLIENGEPAWCVSIAQDSRTLACTHGHDIALWDIGGEKPKQTATLTGHKDTVRRVAFSPNGKMLASTGKDKSVRLWDLGGEKPTERMSLSGHDTDEIYGLAFSADGKWLVSADYVGRAIQWDVGKGTERNRWQMPKGLRVVVFAPDSRHLAMTCDNARIYLLRLPE
jgi:WD40 repeat protein